MAVKQFSVDLQNVPGTLAKLSYQLGYYGINIRGISVVDKPDNSTLRLIVHDPVSAERILKESQIAYTVDEVIAVKMQNVPGALSEITAMLAESNINIKYLYPFISTNINAIIILDTDDNKKAEELINKLDIHKKIITADELYDIP